MAAPSNVQTKSMIEDPKYTARFVLQRIGY